MKTRTWILIFALLLVVCLISGFYFLKPGDASTLAEITSRGQVVKTVDLRIDQTFTVESGNGGFNVITVKDGAIGVSEATCPDHYCIRQGFCNSGRDIVCLPNKLVISFVGEQEIDGQIG